MRVSRRLAWTVLILAILTAALLRHFHDVTPESRFLPWPVRSLLFFLLLILFLLVLRGRRRRQAIPYAGPGLTSVNFSAMVPLLIALIGEKWFSITFYAPMLRAAEAMGLEEPALDAVNEFLSGLGIVIVAVALVPLFPRLRTLLREYFSPHALFTGILGILSVLGLLYGAVAAGLIVLGGDSLYLLPRWFGSWGGLRFSGQALLAIGEEAYYRGLLQTELVFLMPALGVNRPVAAAAAGIGLTSLQFSLEHLGGASAGALPSVMLYTFVVAVFLGAILITLRSLWLCALTHFALNLFVLGGGLQFTDQLGRPVIDPGFYITLFLVLMTLLVYVRFAPERRRLARETGVPD